MSHRSRPSRSPLALVSVLALVAASPACRRTPATPPATPADAARAHTVDATATAEATDGAPSGSDFGPANPWGDGAVPRSTATGPEADRARATLDALRASVGFWRIDQHARTECPTLDALARTPAAAFDPSTMRRDPWDSPYEIECQGAAVHVRSLGPDRQRGTPDDLIAQ